jgi:hypothetical protein
VWKKKNDKKREVIDQEWKQNKTNWNNMFNNFLLLSTSAYKFLNWPINPISVGIEPVIWLV